MVTGSPWTEPGYGSRHVDLVCILFLYEVSSEFPKKIPVL
jgi:hypothetical protein